MKPSATVSLPLILAAALHAQTAPPPPAFEVASIKPATGDLRSRIDVREGRVDFTGVSLQSIAAAAYKLEYFQITSPSWMDFARFDIAAKIPAGVPKEQTPAMLQALLKERFHLRARVETKEGTTYALVARKGRPKLKPAADADVPPPRSLPDGSLPPPGAVVMMLDGPTTAVLRMRAVTVAALCHHFSLLLRLPVVDETGIEGKYDIDLPVQLGMPDGWLDPPPGANMGAGPPPPPPPPTLTPATLAKAVEQMGLKLETRQGPVEYLVVESADRVPTEN